MHETLEVMLPARLASALEAPKPFVRAVEGVEQGARELPVRSVERRALEDVSIAFRAAMSGMTREEWRARDEASDRIGDAIEEMLTAWDDVRECVCAKLAGRDLRDLDKAGARLHALEEETRRLMAQALALVEKS